MTRLRKQNSAIVSLSVLLVVTATGEAIARPLAVSMINPLWTQVLGATAFPVPANVPVGTTIRIGGSSSMETINQVLKRRFEQQFVGTEVALNTQGTGPAIKDLLDGNADLAAIGRSLTEQEKAQGLVPVPVSRHKIAIIVGSQNPFKGDLTFEQFAKIFRGEIKDWSQVGGEPGPIRFIDRPDNSDTRQAFRNYPVFKKAPFVVGKTAKPLAQDSTSQVVQALRTDGIGYAIADQLEGRGDVRVIPMHKTLPSNPKYPFSQPLIYVYKGPQQNPSAQAFLGFATAPASRQTIETARKEASAVIDSNPVSASPRSNVSVPRPQAASPKVTTTPPTVTPSPTSPVAEPSNAFSLWWLLALPLLGGLLWWLLKSREMPLEPEGTLPELTEALVPIEETIAPDVSEVVPEVVAPLLETPRSTGNSRLILVPQNCKNAYAYWEIPADANVALQQQGAQKLVLRLYDVTDVDLTRQPPESLQEFDCDAQAHDRQLPIRTDDRDYLAELGYVANDGRWLPVARSESVRVPACPSQPTLVPETEAGVDQQPPELVDDAVKIGGAALAGSVVADGVAPAADTTARTMLAGDRSHLSLSPEESRVILASRDRTDIYSMGATPTPGLSSDVVELEHDRASESTQITTQSQVFLVPRNGQNAYVYWNVTQADKDALKHQGGQQLVLRVYHVTGTDTPSIDTIQQFLCNEWDRDQQVPIPVSNLDYVAELGYTTLDGRFLKLARSTNTRVSGA
ncbi:MAG: DUF4912 domain-containing protein [Verrucomicrobia bacterium]|nr:DUF4912 domain-containing protein [Leptolyngbya sp. ES-bin-22]